jgi:hypothetical protein
MKDRYITRIGLVAGMSHKSARIIVKTTVYISRRHQVRKALEKRNSNGSNLEIDFKPFKDAYQHLSDKLNPQVFELGFLKA